LSQTADGFAPSRHAAPNIAARSGLGRLAARRVLCSGAGWRSRPRSAVDPTRIALEEPLDFAARGFEDRAVRLVLRSSAVDQRRRDAGAREDCALRLRFFNAREIAAGEHDARAAAPRELRGG